MKPLFIPLDLNKFQICCIPGCDMDAAVEFKVERKDGSMLYITACGEPEHRAQAQSACEALTGNLSPRKCKDVNLEELFIHPAGKKEKCKFLQWEHRDKIEEPKEELKVTVTKTPIREVEITEDWVWVTNLYKWMSVDGQVVPIKALSQEEFSMAAKSILRANFSRITKQRAWVEELREFPVKYKYPEGALEVGYKIAGDKLDEFYQVAEERGWV